MIAVDLVFPPGWTLLTGSAHLSVPLLKATLQAHGFGVTASDLNLRGAGAFVNQVEAEQCRTACENGDHPAMDHLYFSAEDIFESHALKFGGKWNAQLGFEYSDSPQLSSRRIFWAIGRATPFERLFTQAIDEMAASAPRLVGIGLASTYQILPTLQFCRLLRKSGYDGFIVLGGNTVSRLSHELSSSAVFGLVDGLITFQGEMPLLRLSQALERGEPLDSVPQLIWRDEDGIHWNRHNEPFDPNQALPPDYRDLPVGDYWGENYLNLVAARGCYYGKCSFCDIPYGWGEGGYAGQRAVWRVLGDIEVQIQRHGIRRFKFVDEALSPRFMRALSERLLERGLEIEWEGYTRLEAAWNDPDFVSLVARAGFRKGYFGLEVLPSASRHALNKRDGADPETLLGLCSASGVKVHFFCMFGYPGTGEADAVRTVDFLLENSERIDTADIFPWGLAKHSRVPGVRPVVKDGEDWVLEFEHVSEDSSVMTVGQIHELVGHCEEILWQDAPRLLHPIYRLVSPWSESTAPAKSPQARSILTPV